MTAYDMEKNVIFFLKDYWRREIVDKEGDILLYPQPPVSKACTGYPAFWKGK